MRAVFISHVPHEKPGLVGVVAAELGFSVELIEAFLPQKLPVDLGAKDVLIVLGGPMRVADIGSPLYPWLAPLTEWLRARHAQNLPTLGICLGCQLLAHAAGAVVAAMRHPCGAPLKELGWAPIDLLDSQHPITRGLPPQLEVLHWHGDGCALPEGAHWLASSTVCPVQIFQLGKSVGVQFHPEAMESTAAEWALEDAAFVVEAHGPQGVARIQETGADQARSSEASRRQLIRQIFETLLAR